MADELDAAIEQAREEWWEAVKAADLAAIKRDMAEARVEALELAARLRPSSPPVTGLPHAASRGRGRQPGAISQQWRSILIEMADRFPEGANEDALIAIAKTFGLENTRPKDVRERMDNYGTHGYVFATPTGWRVTEAAIGKFKTEKNTADSVIESAV